jgi:hypothetical protein
VNLTLNVSTLYLGENFISKKGSELLIEALENSNVKKISLFG